MPLTFANIVESINNISNNPIWKSWIKPVSLVTFSSVTSIITAPVVAIANYWKQSTKFNFINGWNNFTINPFTFINGELINSFFYTLAFFKIEFCLDTIFINNLNLNQNDKLKTVMKNGGLVISLILLNEIGKNIVYHQWNAEKIWLSLSEDFIFNLGKETVIVIAWKIFKMCLTNNYDVCSYLNSTVIVILMAICYLTVNVGQTLYTIWDMPITNFLPNFPVIFASNTVVSSFRIVSSSFLTAFFNDIAKKWKNSGYCQRSASTETNSLLEVVTGRVNYGAINSVESDIVEINNDNNQGKSFISTNNTIKRCSISG